MFNHFVFFRIHQQQNLIESKNDYVGNIRETNHTELNRNLTESTTMIVNSTNDYNVSTNFLETSRNELNINLTENTMIMNSTIDYNISTHFDNSTIIANYDILKAEEIGRAHV